MGERGRRDDNYSYLGAGEQSPVSHGGESPTDRVLVGLDEWDQPIYERRPANQQRKAKRHSRRLSGKMAAGVAALAVGVGALGLGAKSLLENDEAPKLPTVPAITSQPEAQRAPTPEDPIASFLQKEYKDSRAILQTDRPFPVGLSAADQQRLKELDQKLNDNTLDTADPEFRELIDLKHKEIVVRPAQMDLEELIERHDASFIGKTELSSGHYVNFYKIASESGKQVVIDPKAVDAWEQWGIDHLDDVYQAEDPASPTDTDLQRQQKIHEFQEKAKSGELTYTINYLVNPDEGDCFTKDYRDLVPQTDNSCQALGFASTSPDAHVSIVGLNSINALSTESTYRDPNLKGPVQWIDGAKATLAAFLHEGVGHVSATEANIFPKDKKNDHEHLTVPLTNFVIDTLKKHESNPGMLPPFPLTIS